MSAKWRALQHRHRYTYNAVIFPQQYVDSLYLLQPDSTFSKFFDELKKLTSLDSTYAQVNHVKNVASAFGVLIANGEENSIALAARFYVEVLFLENSLPLHKTLLSELLRSSNFQSLICSCFCNLLEDYSGGKGCRFCVPRVALSIMNTPKRGYLVDVVEECAALVTLDTTAGLNYVIEEINDQSRPSPIVMEQCQEALSCLYYLLQRFPSKFVCSSSFQNGKCVHLYHSQKSSLAKECDSLKMAVATALCILKSPEFSRDCFVAAGVCFWTAIQICLSNQELYRFIMEVIFNPENHSSANFHVDGTRDILLCVPYDGDIFLDIFNISLLSRLCIIRGILTSVPRTVIGSHSFVSNCSILNGFDSHDCGKELSRSILCYRILPELCNYCDNPTDAHFNFHVLTVLQICLQQIKTSVVANPKNFEKFDPISEDIGNRILRIIWTNMEDPLSQTVKQVHQIFDLFLDIQSTYDQACGNERIKLFLRKIASDLLLLGPRYKGKYVPLATLTRRLGANDILDMNSTLLFGIVQAYIDDDVCCAATSFLKCFLECLRSECWRSNDIETGFVVFRRHCLTPILRGLASGNSKLRSNVNTYVLPVLLGLDVDCIFPVLTFVLVDPGAETSDLVCPELSCMDTTLGIGERVVILVSLLKVCRSLALIEGEISISGKYSDKGEAIICIKGITIEFPIEWIHMALTHIDWSVRIDAAESLFISPKTSSLPSSLELRLLQEAVPLNMRCCSTAFQMKWVSLFRKFFARVRTALERQLKLRNMIHSTFHNNYVDNNESEETLECKVQNLLNFMKWLSCFLLFSCYPSAPYERKMMAIELLLVMIDVWPVAHIVEENRTSKNKNDRFNSYKFLYPYSKGFTSPDATLMLVGSITDSWDKLRESFFRILLHFPTPLPGISVTEMVEKLISWAKRLVRSPRVRESDAGSLTLRLVFKKYVMELGCVIRPSSDVIFLPPSFETTFVDPEKKFTTSSPVVEYIQSLVHWLSTAVEEGERDLSAECRNSFVHGILLALRYAFEELDWHSNAVLSSIYEMKHAINMLLDLIRRISSLALWVVSSDAWYLPEDADHMLGEDAYQLELPEESMVPASLTEHNFRNSKIKDVKPPEQIVMVGCWLAMKEVSLLLGTIIRKVPLPTEISCSSELQDANCSSTLERTAPRNETVIQFQQLETVGNLFLEVLLKMKHNGAIDKTRAGFTALCNRLLCSNDPRLCKLIDSWMNQLMERTVVKGQTVDDLLRRSAGIPATFIALFLSEPEGLPKKLLPHALHWLIDLARRSLSGLPEPSYEDKESTNTDEISPPPFQTSKSRAEGVVPTAHAFNTLRAVFNDTNLATDSSGFAAEALIIAIQSFSSPHWEIRNSACLAYTALVRRTIGYLNVHNHQSARRSLTGLEFFHRYPSLHAFLYKELKAATKFFGVGHCGQSASVHPSLCPVLILLSRLKPSTLSSDSGDDLDPFFFMPLIIKCSIQSNLKIRILASKALTSLVSVEKLPSVLTSIVSGLPRFSDARPSLNFIHGMLLQFSCLLDTNTRSLPDPHKKDTILCSLVNDILEHSWIGNSELCPCPVVNAAFLQTLHHLLSICHEKSQFTDLRDLLIQLSLQCLDFEGLSRLYYDPTVIELRKQAAVSYFKCMFEESEVSEYFIQERLILCMSDACYEVRLATFKWIFQFLNSDREFSPSLNLSLHTKLMQLLTAEVNHRCVHYILRILFALNAGVRISELVSDSLSQFWEKLVSLYNLTRHLKIRVASLHCLAMLVKHSSTSITNHVLHINIVSSDKLKLSYDHVNYFVHLVKQCSAPSEVVSMRRAAAESIIACGLLEQAERVSTRLSGHDSEDISALYAREILNIWFISLTLMEDEDSYIRETLAVHAQRCSGRCRSVPSQVEKVIELIFDFLSYIFGNWLEYFDYLTNWVFDTCRHVVSNGDPVRRVFDKEIDNHHEEKLLITQLCCLHLERLPVLNSGDESVAEKTSIHRILTEWRMKFCKELARFGHDEMEIEVDWIGGMGNHKDVFMPLYGNLLGFYMLSKCIISIRSEKRESLLCDVLELGKILDQYLVNPLIYNLYLLVVKIHDDGSGLVPPCNVEDNWAAFDPYFLLR